MKKIVALLAAICGLLLIAPVAAQEAYVRYPDISGDQVVFSHGGDLWIVSSSGGEARRLTSHPGLELFAKFSPDGQWIAFTGQYGGDEQVYVVPAGAGEPRQLTHYPAWGPLASRWGYDNRVLGWSPDGKNILFVSHRDQATVQESQLYTVPAAGGEPKALPLPRGGLGVFSPDGKRVLYSPWSREFRTWKRYQGGWAQDLHIADLDARTIEPVSPSQFTERDPMWTDRGIFFLSDRDGTLNLYRSGEQGGAVKLTDHQRGSDAMWASADRAGNIVYEVVGRLWRYDPNTGTSQPVAVSARGDNPHTRAAPVSVEHDIRDTILSPDGDAVLLYARGDLLVQDLESGVTVNLTRSSNAHEREADWSADGKRIVYISDATGEEEIYLIDADGASLPRQLTRGSRARFYNPTLSPNGETIVVADTNGAIHLVDVKTGQKREVGRSGAFYLRYFEWRADSRWVAYLKVLDTNLTQVNLLDTQSGVSVPVTDPIFDAFSPVFAPDGESLYYLTDRAFAPKAARIDWDFVQDEQTVAMKVSLEGLSTNRGWQAFDSGRERVPVSQGNLSWLAADENHLYYLKGELPPYRSSSSAKLFSFDMNEEKETQLRSAVEGFQLSIGNDGATILAERNNGYELIQAYGSQSEMLSLGDLEVHRDPRAEWKSMYAEAERQFRQYYYDQRMDESDWQAIFDLYRPALERIATREDLNNVIGHAIGELGVGHAHASGLPDNRPERPSTGLLGARFEFKERSGRYCISHIFKGDPANPDFRSPLAEPASGAAIGDCIIAINGRSIGRDVGPYEALRGTANEEVRLTLADDPAGSNTRTADVKTIASEINLIWLEWVEQNRATVDRLSGGRIGYLHIPDMGTSGAKAFIRDYFGQIRKDGLIVDVRGNRGGALSPLIMQRLARANYSSAHIQGVDSPQPYPWGSYTQVFTGNMAMLVNESTMSDGDTIAWMFGEQADLGPLIGKQTWGGVIGTGTIGSLLDGGSVNVPQYELADLDGRPVVEGIGVSPDIEIDYDLAAFREDRDAQLEGAVDALLQRIEGTPGGLPMTETRAGAEGADNADR